MLLPGEPVPVHLMNTIWADRNGIHDTLRTPEGLGDWLSATTGAAVPGLTEHDTAACRTLRNALRRLAAHHTGDTRARAASPIEDLAEAVAEVNRAATAATTHPQLHLTPAGTLACHTTTEATPARAALATIASAAIPLLATEASPLRACYAPGCVVYFTQDHPRREWCSVACGNRVRAARHYQRHR